MERLTAFLHIVMSRVSLMVCVMLDMRRLTASLIMSYAMSHEKPRAKV